MTEQQALQHLRAAVKRQQAFLGVVYVVLVVGSAIWFGFAVKPDNSGPSAAILGVVIWLVVFGGGMWLLSPWYGARSSFASLLATESMVAGEVVRVVNARRFILTIPTGEELLWGTRRARQLEPGQRVWLVPPAKTKESIVAVAEVGNPPEPVMLSPQGPARKPDRCD